MEEILLVAIVGLVCGLCFLLGAKVGQKVVRGETIKTPTINPMKIYENHKENEEAKKEMERLEVILKNIDKYDGTTNGQENIPK